MSFHVSYYHYILSSHRSDNQPTFTIRPSDHLNRYHPTSSQTNCKSLIMTFPYSHNINKLNALQQPTWHLKAPPLCLPPNGLTPKRCHLPPLLPFLPLLNPPLTPSLRSHSSPPSSKPPVAKSNGPTSRSPSVAPSSPPPRCTAS